MPYCLCKDGLYHDHSLSMNDAARTVLVLQLYTASLRTLDAESNFACTVPTLSFSKHPATTVCNSPWTPLGAQFTQLQQLLSTSLPINFLQDLASLYGGRALRKPPQKSSISGAVAWETVGCECWGRKSHLCRPRFPKRTRLTTSSFAPFLGHQVPDQATPEAKKRVKLQESGCTTKPATGFNFGCDRGMASWLGYIKKE